MSAVSASAAASRHNTAILRFRVSRVSLASDPPASVNESMRNLATQFISPTPFERRTRADARGLVTAEAAGLFDSSGWDRLI